MSRLKYAIPVVIILTALIGITQSCKKSSDNPNYNADKTNLSKAIDSATALYNSAVEGKQAGQYTVGSKAAFQTAITLATNVKTGSTFTQQQVNNATANLGRAETAFKNNQIQEISAENLVAYWKFDGDAADASGNGHNGQLKTGWTGSSVAAIVDGGTLPALTTDRYGTANKAYDFKNGAYVEVPYDATLHPTSFSISVWVKIHATNAGNYIISLNRWNGYKYQLQSNNFPYLTVFTDHGYLDVDDNPGTVQLETWTQTVVTFTSGTMKFYINGKLVKTASVQGNPVALTQPVNLSIGNELPKTAYNLTDSNSPNYFYGASFMIGSIDDVRLYNKVLSDAEVNSLYTMEQP